MHLLSVCAGGDDGGRGGLLRTTLTFESLERNFMILGTLKRTDVDSVPDRLTTDGFLELKGHRVVLLVNLCCHLTFLIDSGNGDLA